MKRLGLIILMIISVLLAGVSIAGAGQNIKISVNGIILSSDVEPVIEQGRTLVPLRVIMENLQASVVFDHGTKTITIEKPGTSIILQISNRQAEINGTSTELDVPPVIVADRTMVPLRFIGQALGAEVDWEGSTKTVFVYAPLVDPEAVKEAIFTLVNETRVKQGLIPLVWLEEAAELAEEHSRDMAENDFFSHTSPKYGTPQERAQAAGLPGMAENIAAGYKDAESVFQAWMGSPDHKENILDPNHRFIGIGFYQENDSNDAYGGFYCTQEFVRGNAVLIKPLQDINVTEKYVKVKGYSVKSQAELTVYKLEDRSTYTDKYKAEITVQNGSFEGEIKLTQGKGLYAIQASDYDIRYITYK